MLKTLFYRLLAPYINFRVRLKVITDELNKIITKSKVDGSKQTVDENSNQPIFYVVRHQSASDILTLKMACSRHGLPDPMSKVNVNGKSFYRTLCLEKPSPVLPWFEKQPTSAVHQGFELLKEHTANPELNAQLIPANIIWGRTPDKSKHASFASLPANMESPSWLRKFFVVLFLGGHALIRFSSAIAFREMADKHGTDEQAARKLLRISRVHFYKQILAATGPRLLTRPQMFKQLQANPAVKKAIADEASRKNLSAQQADAQAVKIMYEIAGNYSDGMVRFGDRVLAWLWNKLYQGIEVNNAGAVRKLAQQGHEIVYVPCHRSHMDYLLLTYVIFQQGLVTPRSAAGINLNFWPAGPIFRKAGAFFIRRSFKGDPLYSTIFREYLSLLFERGYPVKFYTEGGRSRTGRLLPPKTGMIAMTIQSMLRGIERPITIVPVYLGYEHVMEVGSYHKELSGSAKKGESLFGVFRAIKSLQNYGKGYVNFGKPININKFLTNQVPQWHEAIDPLHSQKPLWLNDTVTQLSEQIMTNINDHAALNGVALVALILHNTKNTALAKQDLISQLDFYLNIQRIISYSKQVSMPTESAQQLLEQVIALKKVEVYRDSFGEVISLTPAAALDMRYYRNNIIHTFMVPSLVCRVLDSQIKIKHEDIISAVQAVMALTKQELFISLSKRQIGNQIEQVLEFLAEHKYAKKTSAGFWSANHAVSKIVNTHSLGECAHETLQRIMMVINLVQQANQQGNALNEKQLATHVVEIAQRLSLLNQVNAPEFVDKKTQSILINEMVTAGKMEKQEGKLIPTEQLQQLSDMVVPLISTESLQHIISA